MLLAISTTVNYGAIGRMHVLLSSGSCKNGNSTANVEGAMTIRRPATSKSFQREASLGAHLIPTFQRILNHVRISSEVSLPQSECPTSNGTLALEPASSVSRVVRHWQLSKIAFISLSRITC